MATIATNRGASRTNRGTHAANHSPIELVISRLSGVRKTGYGRWTACCPAHDDRSPSLLVTERDDGSIGVHCFSGCDVSAVLGAIGLTLGDLFPPRDNYRDKFSTKPQRAPFNAMDVLRALLHEALVVALAAEQIAKGQTLSQEDAARVALACERIYEAVVLAGGNHVR